MSGKGSSRRKENFKQVQDNWPASMGKKPYWATYSKFSDEFYNENKELIDNNEAKLEENIEFFKLSPEKLELRAEQAMKEFPKFNN